MDRGITLVTESQRSSRLLVAMVAGSRSSGEIIAGGWDGGCREETILDATICKTGEQQQK